MYTANYEFNGTKYNITFSPYTELGTKSDDVAVSIDFYNKDGLRQGLTYTDRDHIYSWRLSNFMSKADEECIMREYNKMYDRFSKIRAFM